MASKRPHDPYEWAIQQSERHFRLLRWAVGALTSVILYMLAKR